MTALTHLDLAASLRKQAAADDAHRLKVLLGKGER